MVQPGQYTKLRPPFVYEGERYPHFVGKVFKNKTEFIRATGTKLHITVVRNRLSLGWSVDDAVSEGGQRVARSGRPKGSTKTSKPTPVEDANHKIPVVYVATSKTTGLKLVGASRKRSPHISWSAFKAFGKSDPELHAKLQALGKDDFEIETVEVVLEGSVTAARESWINRLGTVYPNGYNVG